MQVEVHGDSKSQGIPDRCASRRAAQWVLACAVAVTLAACSAGMRLGYNNADTLLLFSLNNYVPLTAEQEQLVRERTSALVGWHRSTQLRDYAQLLEQARSKLAGPVTAQDVLGFNEAVNARMATLGERAAPELARLALTLTPEQIDRLQRKFADDADKTRREQVKANGDGRIEERLKKQVERTEYWFGSVTPAQRTLLREALLARPDGGASWVGERERRQQELVRVLQRVQSERPDEAAATTWIRRYFASLREPADAERRRAMRVEREQNAELLAQLVNSATPEQRAALMKRLSGFAEDFVALAAERAANTPG